MRIALFTSRKWRFDSNKCLSPFTKKSEDLLSEHIEVEVWCPGSCVPGTANWPISSPSNNFNWYAGLFHFHPFSLNIRIITFKYSSLTITFSIHCFHSCGGNPRGEGSSVIQQPIESNRWGYLPRWHGLFMQKKLGYIPMVHLCWVEPPILQSPGSSHEWLASSHCVFQDPDGGLAMMPWADAITDPLH